MTPVPPTAMWLAFTPLLLGQPIRMVDKPTTMSSVREKWLSPSAITAGRSQVQVILGMPTIKW